MRIPKQLKIGGHLFKVSIKNEWGNSDNDKGVTNWDTGEITLSGGMTPTQIESTLFHEIFHALNGEIDHSLVESLSQQIYQVLKDNKLLNEQKGKPMPLVLCHSRFDG